MEMQVHHSVPGSQQVTVAAVENTGKYVKVICSPFAFLPFRYQSLRRPSKVRQMDSTLCFHGGIIRPIPTQSFLSSDDLNVN